jgi:hypothetical protein
MIDYDPYESVMYLKDKEQEEEEEEDGYDDYYDDYDNNDYTWRVRKSGLKMVQYFNNIDTFMQSIMMRMDEQNENVRKMSYDSVINNYER